MSCGWEGNRRSGLALAMRHRLQWFKAYRREMSTPPTLLLGYGALYSHVGYFLYFTMSSEMRHRLQWFIHLPANGLRKGDEHPADTPHVWYGTSYLYSFRVIQQSCILELIIFQC